MFEKGLELKKQFGEDSVCDFSLGNPDVPPPAKTREVLLRIADEAVRPLGLGYCPNAGIPAVREAIANHLAKQQGVRLSAADVVMTGGVALNGALRERLERRIGRPVNTCADAQYVGAYGAALFAREQNEDEGRR